jgi:hypothetical protein
MKSIDNGMNSHTYFSKTFNLLARLEAFAHLSFGANTAIPYRESTGFLQGSPCVVILPLHALAVNRV